MKLLEITYNISLKAITFCRYELLIEGKLIKLSFPQLLQLRNKLNYYNTNSVLEHIIDTDNFVLLFVSDNKHLLYLDVPQLIDLKNEVGLFFSDYNTSSF